MNKAIVALCGIVGLTLSALVPPYGAVSIMVVIILCVPAFFIIKNYSEGDEQKFLLNIFFVALLARLVFGFGILLFDITTLIAEDTETYHFVGYRFVEIMRGVTVPDDLTTYRATSKSIPGWGMYQLVGLIYYTFGTSLYIAQSFCAVFGAATAPFTYFCAKNIYNNQRVAKIAAMAIALYPSFILWSSQVLKDGLIIFLLVVAMTMVLQIQKKFSYLPLLILLFSLFAILSLRFYIFYMVLFAVAGSFVVGLNTTSVRSVVRNTAVVVLLGIGLTYLGVVRTAGTDFSQYADLSRIQASRADLSTTESGFGEDIDVGTTAGAVTALPVGFSYLMFAPFPWQVSSFRQTFTLPEVLLWWSLIPLLISGLWYTLKHRLRTSIPILIFSLMLTIAYSIFQGNVGTAYRQRTQIQVFLFIFIAVGWSLWRERRENKIIKRQIEHRKFEKRMKRLKET